MKQPFSESQRILRHSHVTVKHVFTSLFFSVSLHKVYDESAVRKTRTAEKFFMGLLFAKDLETTNNLQL